MAAASQAPEIKVRCAAVEIRSGQSLQVWLNACAPWVNWNGDPPRAFLYIRVTRTGRMQVFFDPEDGVQALRHDQYYTNDMAEDLAARSREEE